MIARVLFYQFKLLRKTIRMLALAQDISKSVLMTLVRVNYTLVLHKFSDTPLVLP